MVIEYNKKIKVVSPKLHFHGGKPKPNPTLAKPNPNPQQVHLHEKVDPNQHSTICNPEPKPSFVLDTTNPQSQPIHSPDICPSPDNPPQDVDKSDLSESTSITTNLNETCCWIPHVTICFIRILPAFHLNYKTPQVLKVLKLNLFLFLRNLWKVTSFHQEMFSVYNMNMTCPYSFKRYILHLTISTIRTLMSVKSKVKMTSSFMPLTLATTLHYPNSWHITTGKTWSPLIPQVHVQPLPKLPVITPPIQVALIIKW